MAAPITAAETTNFPLGVSSRGFPLLGSGPYLTSGEVFFVDSTASLKGDDASHGRTMFQPFATIDFAIGQCTANRGDIIFVLPGHTETLTSANAINLDVAGVSVIGMTQGRARPTLTLASSTAASIDVNAANCKIENVVIDMTGIDAIIAGINVKAADFELRNCELITATASGQAVTSILTDANANRMRVLGNFFNGYDITGNSVLIDLVGAVDSVVIANNRFKAKVALYVIRTSATSTNIVINNNQFQILTSGSGIDYETGSTGLCFENYFFTPTPSTAIITSSTVAFLQNYATDTGLAAGEIVAQTLVPLANIATSLGANYLEVTVDFTSATWNTVATHEVLTVTGFCRIRLLIFCVTDVTGAGSIQFGHQLDTDGYIASTTGTDIDQNECWFSATPSLNVLGSNILDIIPGNGQDVGYEITGAALTGGSLLVKCWWESLNGNNGSVVAGAGGTL